MSRLIGDILHPEHPLGIPPLNMQTKPGYELCLRVCILESLTEDLTLTNDESKHHIQLKILPITQALCILASTLQWRMGNG